MENLEKRTLQRQLEWVLRLFFVLVALSLVVVFLVAPGVYSQILAQKSGAMFSPLAATLFLVGVLALIAVLLVGLRRQWRWVFWGILLAFSAAVLDIPVTLLQLVGVVPNLFPVWYSLYRMGIACVQVVIAVWMWRIYARHGTWALGKKKDGRVGSSRT